MGVGIAFPLSEYVLESCSINTCARTKKWPPMEGVRKVATEETGTSSSAALLPLAAASSFANLFNPLRGFLSWFGAVKGSVESPASSATAVDPWDRAKERKNTMILLRLQKRLQKQDKATNQAAGKAVPVRFCVGTYHMPCAFREPQVMVIHTALCVSHALRFSKGLPLIFAGDFNFTPGSAPYRLLTEGCLNENDAAYPPPPSNPLDKWRVNKALMAAATAATAGTAREGGATAGLQSAYHTFLGKEPTFTNFAFTEWDTVAFKDTLDYIFLSPHWTVEAVEPLPEDDDTQFATPSLPTIEEPSDHLMLVAQVSLA